MTASDGARVAKQIAVAAPVPAPAPAAAARAELRAADPALANTDPLGAGWFFKVKLANPAEVDALLDETAYNQFSAG